MGLVQYQNLFSCFHVYWNIAVFLVQPLRNVVIHLQQSSTIRLQSFSYPPFVFGLNYRNPPVAKPSPSSYTLTRYPKYSTKPPSL